LFETVCVFGCSLTTALTSSGLCYSILLSSGVNICHFLSLLFSAHVKATVTTHILHLSECCNREKTKL